MTAFVDRVLSAFPADVARLWIAADPDDVLLDEAILASLRDRGFVLVPFEDSIAFRLVYEDDFRRRWEAGDGGAPKSLILHLRSDDASNLPADYLAEGRLVALSLAELFPRMSYAVLRQLDPSVLAALYDAQIHASQDLGEAGTKEFVLLHIHRLSPHLISHVEELWSALFKLHYRGDGLPSVLADHIAAVLAQKPALAGFPLAKLFASRAVMLQTVQRAWERYVNSHGLSGRRIGEEEPVLHKERDIPFDHPEVRVFIDSMFLDGALHPIEVEGSAAAMPEWARVGVIPNPMALRNLVAQGIKSLKDSIPADAATHKEWIEWARRFGEVSSRHHVLDASRAESFRVDFAELRAAADVALFEWCNQHFGDLASLPAVKVPVMVHRVPAFLAMRRSGGESKVALVVFDGLAIDQWVTVRESLVKSALPLSFDEAACFAWLPTLTSVSRQALFSGLRPREFAGTIESTAAEPQLWVRFWQDQGLKAAEVVYRKGLRRNDQLDELEAALSGPAVKVAGLVVDTVDEIIHGAVLGKRGVAGQVAEWCSSGFVARLFDRLLGMGFHVYLTADHGNVDAVGAGRPAQGVAAEMRGERVRTYRSETIRADTALAWPETKVLDVPGLPAGFLPLYAGHGIAFGTPGDPLVVHGGPSVEELIVPFVKVSRTS
ncbi:MAG: BREX-3 system phosphatase PglZ [Burkholderiaceae bacterium]|nr:BREX-3 system phosphatase PglZ [Burkholderiaceae bacterium]